MRILFIGDIVGRAGRRCVKQRLPELRDELALDFVAANGENIAGGLGATADTVAEVLEGGVDVLTMGNHTWRKKEFVRTIGAFSAVVRPANYPQNVPGVGSTVFKLEDGRQIAIVNLLGRVFMDPIDCPFVAAAREVDRLRETISTVLVDFHAEATAEKVAMGWFLDGRCTAVVGTHTHVQTADERVLPKGAAYITDVGMTGPFDSVIGVERNPIVKRFLDGMPTEFKVAKDGVGLNAVVIDTDDHTGRAISIDRVVRQD